MQFARQPWHDGSTPACAVLDDPTDVPAEAQEFAIDGRHRPRPGSLDAALHVGEQRREVGVFARVLLVASGAIGRGDAGDVVVGQLLVRALRHESELARVDAEHLAAAGRVTACDAQP